MLFYSLLKTLDINFFQRRDIRQPTLLFGVITKSDYEGISARSVSELVSW